MDAEGTPRPKPSNPLCAHPSTEHGGDSCLSASSSNILGNDGAAAPTPEGDATPGSSDGTATNKRPREADTEDSTDSNPRAVKKLSVEQPTHNVSDTSFSIARATERWQQIYPPQRDASWESLLTNDIQAAAESEPKPWDMIANRYPPARWNFPQVAEGFGASQNSALTFLPITGVNSACFTGSLPESSDIGHSENTPQKSQPDGEHPQLLGCVSRELISGPYMKLDGAPSENLGFPENGNITVAEMFAYLPNGALQTWGAIERIMANGWITGAIVYMINRFREGEVPITVNFLVKIVTESMRANPSTKKWTMTGARKATKDNWDSTSLSVAGFRPPRLTHPRTGLYAKEFNVKQTIPFKDLVKFCKDRPSGPDALDLSRCINYHIAHPEETWLYPDDFEKLVSHVGGPLPISEEHRDPEAAKRWEVYRAVGAIHEKGITGEQKAKKLAAMGKNHGRARVERYGYEEDARLTALEASKEPQSDTATTEPTQLQGNSAGQQAPVAVMASFFLPGNDAAMVPLVQANPAAQLPLVGAEVSTPSQGQDPEAVQAAAQPDSATPTVLAPSALSEPEAVPTQPALSELSGMINFALGDYLSPTNSAPVLDNLAGVDTHDATASTLNDSAITAATYADSMIGVEPTGPGQQDGGGAPPHSDPRTRAQVDAAIATAYASASRTAVAQVPEAFHVAPQTNYPEDLSVPTRENADLRHTYNSVGVRSGHVLTADPYQFEGPREHPPYRLLMLLDAPRDNDLSDWAENIRFVREYGLNEATEDPATQAMLTRRRREIAWISLQFVIHVGQLNGAYIGLI